MVRAAFVVLGATGFGVVAYGLLWLTMPVALPDEGVPAGRAPRTAGRPAAPGVAGVLRGGPGAPSRRQVIGLALLGFGAVSLLGKLSTFGGSDVVLPLVLVAIGLAVIWRQLDATARWPGRRCGGCSPAAGCSPRPASCCCWPPPASWPTPATASPPPW